MLHVLSGGRQLFHCRYSLFAEEHISEKNARCGHTREKKKRPNLGWKDAGKRDDRGGAEREDNTTSRAAWRNHFMDLPCLFTAYREKELTYYVR